MAQAIIAQMKKVDKIGTLFLNSNNMLSLPILCHLCHQYYLCHFYCGAIFMYNAVIPS